MPGRGHGGRVPAEHHGVEQIGVDQLGQAALDLLARVLLADGDRVWMEEPGYPGGRGAFLGAGARLSPLPVGRTGWQVPPPADPPPRRAMNCRRRGSSS